MAVLGKGTPTSVQRKPTTGLHTFTGLEEVTGDDDKVIFAIAGDKGHGKTSLAFALEGEVWCLSLDHKSQSIKKGMYAGVDRIHVVDVMKYMDYTDQHTLLNSSAKTYDYIIHCIGEIAKKGRCDWIVLDGLRQFSQCCEMKMRTKNNLKAFQGISNLNVWKDRNLNMRHVHTMMLGTCSSGVVYTTYFKLKEMKDSDGSMVAEKKPHYADIVEEETDIILFAKSVRVQGKKVYLMECDSSKRPDIIESGAIVDVTGKTGLFKDMVKGKGETK